MRVLVQILRDEERTDSGLYLPAGAKEASDDALYGKVSGIPHGAHVLFRKEAGVRVPWDDKLRVIDVKDILATVEEVHAEQVQ
jgi:co-chaperonin GroES (HSP10)